MNIYNTAQKFENLRKSFIKQSAIHITNNKTVLIENCNEIEAFNENCITVILRNNKAVITGLDLTVDSYSNDCVIIRGSIHSINFKEKD